MSELLSNSEQELRTDTGKNPQSTHSQTTSSNPSNLSHTDFTTTDISWLEQVIARFFQEKNIRWLLFVGAAIIVGSSLMLVSHKWSEWSITTRFFTIVGYTGTLFCFGEYCGTRLGLRSTGNVLRILTLLLIPINFLSLSWLASNEASLIDKTQFIFLTSIAATGAWFTSGFILEKLFHGKQKTFHVVFLLLSLAGVSPNLSSLGSPSLVAMVGFILWLVTCLGIIKINRLVFWLTEHQQYPKVFGFFPILLLGSQFLLIATTKLLHAMNVEWIGFGLTLCAIPILLTARTVSNVFRQRTGELVYPYPISIIAPYFFSVVFLATGFILSTHGFHFSGQTTYALIPTALIAGGLAILLANDTQFYAFTWIGLVLIAIAYQSSPTLMSDLVHQIKSTTATALSEERLPVAFYGLTYLPFLATLVLIGQRWLSKDKRYFIEPMQQFVTIVSILLLAISFTHVKAVWIISIVHAATFVFYALAYRDRRYTLVSNIAVIASFTATPLFLQSMHWDTWLHGIHLPVQIAIALGSLGLLYTLLPFDRLIERIELSNDTILDWIFDSEGRPLQLIHLTGVILGAIYALMCLLLIGGTTLEDFAIGNPFDIEYMVLIGIGIISLVNITLTTRHYLSGFILSTFVTVTGGAILLRSIHQPEAWINWTTILSALFSAVGYAMIAILFRKTADQFHSLRKLLHIENLGEYLRVTAFGHKPGNQSSDDAHSWILSIVLPASDLALVLFIPCLSLHTVLLLLNFFDIGSGTFLSSLPIAILWLIFVSVAVRSRIASGYLAAVLPIAILSTFEYFSEYRIPAEILPVTLALLVSSITLIANCVQSEHLLAIKKSFQLVGTVWLSIIILANAVVLSVPLAFAGLISLATLFIIHRPAVESSHFGSLCIIGNILLGVLSIALTTSFPLPLYFYSLQPVGLIHPLLFFVTTLSLLFFQAYQLKLHSQLSFEWIWTLRISIVFQLGVILYSAPYGPAPGLIFLASIIALTISEFYESVKLQREGRLWTCMAGLGLCLVWFHIQNWLSLDHPFWPAIAVASSTLALIAFQRNRENERWQFALRTLETIGLTGPCIATIYTLVSHFGFPHSQLIAWKTLTIFASSAVYFHYGWTLANRRFTAAAIVTFNIAILFLATNRSLTSLEWYFIPIGVSIIGLTELFKRELTTTVREQFRYAGTLVILVSPLFEIVRGSWIHMFVLLVLCVGLILVAMGLKMKALLYLSTAFLLADLGAMVIRSCLYNPAYLWAVGLVIGASVIALAALFENHRENLLAKIRSLSVELTSWQ